MALERAQEYEIETFITTARDTFLACKIFFEEFYM